MKKKIILAGLLLTMCVGLTACGNPLKELPEVSEENIYNTEEETTGNEAADEIIDTLTDTDEGGVDGEVLSFAVYDRDDNEENKEKSDVYVEIVIETEEVEYTGYYIVEMKYDKERGWRVDEFELDEDEECSYKPLVGVDDQEIWDTIYYDLDEFYIDDRYFYIYSDNMGEVTPITNEIYEEDGVYYNELTVAFEYVESYCSYNMEYKIVYSYQYDEYSNYGYWYLSSYEYPTSCEQVIDENIYNQLTEERMLEDLSQQGYSYNYYADYAYFTTENCDYTFDGYEFGGSYIYANFTFTPKNTESFTVTTDVQLEYYYDGSECTLSWCYIEPVYSDVNLSGNYSGVIYDGYGDRLGDVYYSFLGTNEDGNIYGAAKWTIDGLDDRNQESVNFIVYSWDDYYVEIDFEDSMYYADYSSIGYDYLYFNPVTGEITSATYSYNYVLTAE